MRPLNQHRVAPGRLLRTGVAEAAAVVAAPAPALAAFAEDQSAELRDRIFDEFNSLAVILRAPSATFVPPAPHAPLAEEPELAAPVRALRAWRLKQGCAQVSHERTGLAAVRVSSP